MKHILIVGGTGMLREATSHFIEQGHIVSIMARNRDRLNAFKTEYPVKKGRIWTIPQDYCDWEEALKKVRQAAEMFVRIDLAILWIHDTGRQFSDLLKRFLFLHNSNAQVYQLRGSVSVNPVESGESEWSRKYPYQYREIILGYQRQDDSHSRWLTNREISEGIIQAVEEDKPTFTIGQTEFWDRRP